MIRSHIVALSISSNDPSSLALILRNKSPRRARVSSSSLSVNVDARDTREDCAEENAEDNAPLGAGGEYQAGGFGGKNESPASGGDEGRDWA